MFTRALSVAGLALMLTSAHAAESPAPDAGMETATSACAAVNQYGPVETVTAVQDGLGDWAVWLKDKDGDVWLCNATSAGAVYTNVMMQGDLLSGDGGTLIGFQSVANRTGGGGSPAVAETLCSTIGSHIEPMQVIATVEDGIGDYLVWLKNANEELWLCNASADAKLYDFEPIGIPINDVTPPRFA